MKKLIISGVAVAVLSIGSFAYATVNTDPVKENQASLQRSESVEEPVLHSSTVETQETTPEVQTGTVQPVQNQPNQTPAETAPAVQEEPFDAQLYGLSLLQAKASQGISMNADCYNKLMVDSTGWNMSREQVDTTFAKVLSYSSTCAAYAQFKSTGSY